MQIQSLFNRKFKVNLGSTRQTISAICCKYMATGSVAETLRLGRPRRGPLEENIEMLQEAYTLSQGKSISRAAVKLDISQLSIQQMLRKDFMKFLDNTLGKSKIT